MRTISGSGIQRRKQLLVHTYVVLRFERECVLARVCMNASIEYMQVFMFLRKKSEIYI